MTVPFWQFIIVGVAVALVLVGVTAFFEWFFDDRRLGRRIHRGLWDEALDVVFGYRRR